ncbi:DUF5071 domain-containing protein [Cohnella nanjingensis]|uniref:DUF5071 domain-containing protein n=1 Tax=Cohnella nanjingensis TaxID=1387779 RepID=A0A7X0RV00_9BACL|nr:DUF5071 domain-containing protein [Cohnella nanjingensis]MBB6672885.1 DUF5071 domain-containing protein [Cohnella nanjingensis]
MEDYLSIYLPRDKHDFERVYNLPTLSPSIVNSIIPKLVEWLQDINWPIATEIAEFLLKHPEETIPHIKEVLADLARIALTPTEGEKLEEVNETAQEILKMIDNV